jgi:hypothetical protein
LQCAQRVDNDVALALGIAVGTAIATTIATTIAIGSRGITIGIRAGIVTNRIRRRNCNELRRRATRGNAIAAARRRRTATLAVMLLSLTLQRNGRGQLTFACNHNACIGAPPRFAIAQSRKCARRASRQ